MEKNTFRFIKNLFDKAIDSVRDLKKRSAKERDYEENKPRSKVRGLSMLKDGDLMRVEISSASVAKSTATILLVLALAYFLVQISEILLLFFVAFLFTAGLDHTVTRFQKRFRIPRGLSVVFLYVIIFTAFALTISSLAPLVADQLSAVVSKIFEFFDNVASGNSELPFADTLAPYFQQFTSGVELHTVSAQISESLKTFSVQLLSFGENIWSAVVVISNGLLNTTIVLVLTFFMVVEWRQIEDAFISLFPTKHTEYVVSHLDAIKSKIGYWLRGQLMLSLAVGILTYVGLLIIGMDYAVTLALIAALTEVIPVVGPLIAWLVALPVAANISAWMLLWVTITYGIIQQVEGNVLVPLIMKKAVGLSPVIVIFAMLVGYNYLGILGVVLSIPIAASLAIFAKDYTKALKGN